MGMPRFPQAAEQATKWARVANLVGNQTRSRELVERVGSAHHQHLVADRSEQSDGSGQKRLSFESELGLVATHPPASTAGQDQSGC
jgi:hypothetical protein